MIERNGDFFILICDICGDCTPEEFDDFRDAVAYKWHNGWRSQKHQGEWEDVCPECQEG